ncbi:ABC transporter substrate-binding protein [Aurantimonas aggregata]|uniref:ABC transporter substrate-binding protein n=1 Tax=Aurantimonas aggregata TaxID=2047720 RepID=A0A6L9MNK2_9HYPH|nr:ABC transporter substrate-binding protein [Aurantimonas aggregata]
MLSVSSLPAFAQLASSSVLRFVPSTNLASLDPHVSTALVTVQHGYYVFDTLYGVDANLTPQPQMAERHEVSEDRLTWTIILRDGLTFHDGEPVRAADCAASLARWSQRDGLGKSLAAAVDRYEAVDDKSFRIHLKAPFPKMLEVIGKPHSSPAFIMPERLANTPAEQPIQEMVGSGPYRFKADEFNPGSRVVYTKFEEYVPRDEEPSWTSGGKVAHFDRIEWHIITDKATAASALQLGEVDWLENMPSDLALLFPEGSGVEMKVSDPLGTGGFMRFNHTTAPFDNVKLRQFVARLVNQEDYLASFSGVVQDPTICRNMFPCTIPGVEEEGQEELGSLVGASADEIAAALAKTGYEGERIVVLNPVDSADITPFAVIIADAMSKAGLNVDMQDMDFGTLLQRRASKAPVEEGGWSIAPTSWPSVAIANPALNTTIRGEGAAGWAGWFESAEIEEKVADWLNAESEEDESRIREEVNEIALREVPSLPLGIYFPVTAYRSELEGVLGGSVRYPWNVRRR